MLRQLRPACTGERKQRCRRHGRRIIRILLLAAPPVGDPSKELQTAPWNPVSYGRRACCSLHTPPKPPLTWRSASRNDLPACLVPPPWTPFPPPGLCLQRRLLVRRKQWAGARSHGRSCCCWPSWLLSASLSIRRWSPTASVLLRLQKWEGPVMEKHRRPHGNQLISTPSFSSQVCEVSFALRFNLWSSH